MGEDFERPKGEAQGRLTETVEVPPLVVQRDALVFSVGQRCVTLRLEALMERGEEAAVGLLLWGNLLKLRDIDQSLRRIATVAEHSDDQARLMREGGAQTIISDVLGHLRDLGIVPPVVAAPSKQAAGGDGASAS